MAQTAAQIITLATQIAKVPGMTSQALIFLNAILDELVQDYDFEIIRKTSTFNLSTTAAGNGYAPGSGPNAMPADFVRLHREGSFYTIVQVPYKLIGVKQEEFDRFVQQVGLASYPYLAYVDVTQVVGEEPGLYVWPPAAGSYPATIRYQALPAAITDTASTPWFPNNTYLITRLAGELCKISGDDRVGALLGDTDPKKDTAGSAASILRSYLTMKDDPETAVKRVELDRRFFGVSLNNLRNTKTIGWTIALLAGGMQWLSAIPPL